MNILQPSKKLILSIMTLSLLAGTTSAMAMRRAQQDQEDQVQPRPLIIRLIPNQQNQEPAVLVPIQPVVPVQEQEPVLPGAHDFQTMKAVRNVVIYGEDEIDVHTTHSTGEYQLMMKEVYLSPDTKLLRVRYAVEIVEGGFSIGILKGRLNGTESWTNQKAYVEPGLIEDTLELTEADFVKFGIARDGTRENKLSITLSNCRPQAGVSHFKITKLFWELVEREAE
jgi:hypothetical protein